MTLVLQVLSVNAGRIRTIGERNGAPLLSAFVKELVPAGPIRVFSHGLDGDEHADSDAHGGPDRAVYAYPADHWPWWGARHRMVCAPAAFGENLTVAGADETAVAIGDRFSWGDVVLEVSQPRTPCHKFDRVSGLDNASLHMTRSGRCGWHFRVLEPGLAPIQATLVRSYASGGPSVRDIFAAGSDKRIAPEIRKKFAAAPGLPLDWRRKLGGG